MLLFLSYDPSYDRFFNQSLLSLTHYKTEREATFVDAPVSGGVMAASAGTLTFMVGANSPEDFEKAKSLLLDMGKNVTHCGKVGSGGAVKICNNSKLKYWVKLKITQSIFHNILTF